MVYAPGTTQALALHLRAQRDQPPGKPQNRVGNASKRAMVGS